VNSNHIILTFSEAVRAGAGNIIISGVNPGGLTDVRTVPVGDLTQVTFTGTTVDINPGADLRNGYTYNVQFSSGVITDLAGNAWAGINRPTTLNFTRGSGGAAGPQTVIVSEVNSNATPADFFELYNYGTDTVDLTGWRWDDDSASFTDSGSAAFASGTTIAAGGRLVVVAAPDAAAFRTAWGLSPEVVTVATGGPGLGSGDAIVVFNSAGQAVTAVNYKGTAISATDGALIPVSAAASGVTFAVGHAGAAYGGTATASAIWDGVSTSAPAYRSAAVGVLGGFAQPAAAANVGSPGAVAAGSAPDTTAPTLISSAPGDNAASVSTTASLVLTFSEAVKAGTGSIVINNTATAGDTRTIAVTDTSQVTFSGGVVTVNPTANLAAGNAYHVTLGAGVILDNANNPFAGIADTTTLNFVTATSAPTLLITELNSNAGPEDFFEIYNYGASAINLSGWKWDDDSASFSDPSVGTFAAGTTLAAGGRLVVIAGTNTDAFRTAWGMSADAPVVSTGGSGLGQNDAVVLFNDGGSVVTSFNYSGSAKNASDGSVIPTSPASHGVTFTSGHAGTAYGGTLTTSAVWDGLSVTAPSYRAASVGVDGGVAQAATPANIGSPGSVPSLDVGEVRFLAANTDATDAFAFILLQAVSAGTRLGFTDRNFSEATGMPVSGESAYLWTADTAYNAGTIVTIQPDVASGTNPIADKGTVQGAGGGLSTTAETIYAFQGSIAGLLDGGAGAITIDRLLASLNVGGAAAGDVPTSIAAASQSFNSDNAKYTASTSATDITALVASIGNPANWTLNDTTAFALSNGSLF
jgi:methionine-rich copper-binding protein CopC